MNLGEQPHCEVTWTEDGGWDWFFVTMPWKFFCEEFCNTSLGYDFFLHWKNPIFFYSASLDRTVTFQFHQVFSWKHIGLLNHPMLVMLHECCNFQSTMPSFNMAINLWDHYFHHYIIHYNLFFLLLHHYYCKLNIRVLCHIFFQPIS